jgi:hypothetical protein
MRLRSCRENVQYAENLADIYDFESYVVCADGFWIVGVFITATVSCRLWQAESYESNHIHLFAGGVKHAGPRCLLPGWQAPQHHAHLA